MQKWRHTDRRHSASTFMTDQGFAVNIRCAGSIRYLPVWFCLLLAYRATLCRFFTDPVVESFYLKWFVALLVRRRYCQLKQVRYGRDQTSPNEVELSSPWWPTISIFMLPSGRSSPLPTERISIASQFGTARLSADVCVLGSAMR